MYYKINDFERDWEFESDATSKILTALTDDSLNQSVSAEGRTIGRLAWHITTTVGEMLTKVGLKTECPDEDFPIPQIAVEIVNAYKKVSNSVLEEIKKNWNDDSLFVEVNMYGEMWKNGQTLQILINHQIHHRAQITVLMRQAGLMVPGIYGPSKEEWVSMGMQPMK